MIAEKVQQLIPNRATSLRILSSHSEAEGKQSKTTDFIARRIEARKNALHDLVQREIQQSLSGNQPGVLAGSAAARSRLQEVARNKEAFFHRVILRDARGLLHGSPIHLEKALNRVVETIHDYSLDEDMRTNTKVQALLREISGICFPLVDGSRPAPTVSDIVEPGRAMEVIADHAKKYRDTYKAELAKLKKKVRLNGTSSYESNNRETKREYSELKEKVDMERMEALALIGVSESYEDFIRDRSATAYGYFQKYFAQFVDHGLTKSHLRYFYPIFFNALQKFSERNKSISFDYLPNAKRGPKGSL